MIFFLLISLQVFCVRDVFSQTVAKWLSFPDLQNNCLVLVIFFRDAGEMLCIGRVVLNSGFHHFNDVGLSWF